ncbi:hypothetical protein WR25_11512 isoform A [Diploscapter pachys]|uniref:Major facilitator superfamily (MFS) profile domain-containing protein n=1 Tax=Diploscapter pachys TaxID=2018661 RepID=A0A2A2JJY8_9BILA|nr:hypothetical protein WR25_11512 isoform A [Diploscapter pachys]
MTCMINSTAEIDEDYAIEKMDYVQNYDAQKCTPANNSKDPIDYGGNLHWSKHQQNIVFSGQFWGGCLTVLPSMLLIQKYPAKYVYLIVIFLYTLSNSLTPLFAQHLGYQATFVVRFLMGMSDGFVTPSINTFISQWFPVNERSTALGLNAIGEQLAGVTESPLAALFCQSSFGWPAVFYVAGIIGTIWCTIWLFAGSSNPYECRKITEKERNYLLSANGSNLKKQATSSWRNVPFKAIFTSIPFLAQLQCHFLMCFSSALLETYLPTYFKEVLLLGVITVSRIIVNGKANENSRTVSTFHYRISSTC